MSTPGTMSPRCRIWMICKDSKVHSLIIYERIDLALAANRSPIRLIIFLFLIRIGDLFGSCAIIGNSLTGHIFDMIFQVCRTCL